MRLDEKWIRAHLPPDCADEPSDVFSGYYLDGLTVMSEGERGGPVTVVYRAKSEEEMKYWQLESICHFVGKADHSKVWRYYRDHAEDGKWFYIERRHYDYNASVKLNKTALTLKVGQTATLNAVLQTGTSAATRTYRSSNSSIVKMTRTDWVGTFKAVKPGVAWVSVKLYNGKVGTCKVTVVK